MTNPCIDSYGCLVIPFDSDPKYHWWCQGGQRPEITMEELSNGTINAINIDSPDTGIVNPVLDVVRDRDVPFNGAYTTRKMQKDRDSESAGMAGDNLSLF